MGENIFSKTITALAFFSVFVTQQALGQITDNFSDGDFLINPTWSGTQTAYIINAGGRLQLNATVAGNSFLSVPFSIPSNHNAQWEFAIHQNFSGSNQNLTRVYLMSDSQDPTLTQNGYYLQFGETGTNDPIDLFRVSGGSAVSILRGSLGFVAAAFNIRVRVTRSSLGAWEIFADNTAGTNFTSQGTASDNTVQSCSYFIVRSTYTISNISNFSYDDVALSIAEAPDILAPSISSVTVISSSQVKLNFSEALDVSAGLTALDFVLNDTVSITNAVFEDNDASINLTVNEAMINGRTQKIAYPNLSDPSGNVLSSGNKNFLFFEPVEPQQYDLVFTELYPDPSPSIGLPEFEYVEIYNRSEHPFQLENWQITDGTTIATLSARILLPGEYLTISSNAAITPYMALGPAMGVTTFPSLNNSADNLQLKSPSGMVIDAQAYTLSWYHDEDKDAGGFSLERIDPTNFCREGENWRASLHGLGGTPGHQNSVFQITPDVTGPSLLEVVPKTSAVVTLRFDERMAATLPALENFGFNSAIEKTNAEFADASFTEIDLTFASDLDSASIHTVSLSGFFDCPGNLLKATASSASFKMDMVKPTVVSLQVINQSQLEVTFSEKIFPASLSPTAIAPTLTGEYAVSQSENKKILTITFATPLVNGKEYSIVIRELIDFAGNVMNEDLRLFRYFQPQPLSVKDLVINEFLADPTPVVGLPEGEFIEIYNRSEKAHNLLDWTITDGSTVGTLPDKIILPQEHVILCPLALSGQYANHGTVIGLSTFPSLNNSGDMMKLIAANGVTIDSIAYVSKWYQNDTKEDGGWTIERIDPNDFCGEIENWRAGENALGGTPGKPNSILAYLADKTAPDLLTISVHATDSIVIHFSERLSTTAINVGNFVFDPVVQPKKIDFTDGDKRNIGLKLYHSLDSTTNYHLHLNNIFDCPGNNLHPDSSRVKFKLDNTLPFVRNVVVRNPTSVVVTFSEKIDPSDITIMNFSLDVIAPEKATLVSAFAVELEFAQPLINGKKYNLHSSNISDLAGNRMTASVNEVSFFEGRPVHHKDIIISEIFADPSPTVGLPEIEFIEIYNRGENAVQLKNWIFADQTHEVRLGDHILLPEEFLVLTLSSKAFQFKNAMGVVSFPTLTNSGEPLLLKDSVRTTIDSVFYSDDWYNDSEKQDGGWSLEIIDPNNICSEGENWTSSNDLSGGTPGRINSVLAEKPDLTMPRLVGAFALASDTLILEFNEKLSERLPAIADVIIIPPVGISTVKFSNQSKRSYTLTLSSGITSRIRYKVYVKNAEDCAGNRVELTEELFFALPENAEPGDVVINEILFNPRPTGVDFIELFNRSEKFINLKDWTCANLVNDTIVNRKAITNENVIIEPQDFLALTVEPNVLKGEYLQGNEHKFLAVNLPTLSDNAGSVVLLVDEIIIDTVFYNEDQHSPFLKSNEGVSLERIDSYAPSAPANWHSASASSGYATPALPNSSAFQSNYEQAVSVEPEIFSPQSGSPDFAMIAYRVEQTGYVANIKIIDQQGRIVKTVVENELLGAQGFFKWHGDTNQGTRAASGAYMIWFEMFDSSGNVATIKKRVVIAERF